MAATTTNTTSTTAAATTSALASNPTIAKAHFKVQPHPSTAKPKRRKCKETTISFSAADSTAATKKLDPPTVFSADRSCCCPRPNQARDSDPECKLDFKGASSATITLTSGGHSPGQASPFPSSFTKFNSVLTAGSLNVMFPPPDKTRASPTLFEMMANEPEMPQAQRRSNSVSNPPQGSQSVSALDRKVVIMQRLVEMLWSRSPGSQFNDASTGDVRLTLSSKDGVSVSMSVHRQILVAHSRFFAVKLSDRWGAKQQPERVAGPYVVEIADCDDVEVYIETLRLMYCRDLRRRLMREDVAKVLGILKVSAAIGFDAGVLSCLEYLEAAPWAEDEEEKVASLLSELRLEGVGAGEVLKRVSVEVTNGAEESTNIEEVLFMLLNVVLEGKDEKARREMKGLVSKMLRENSSQIDLRKESLYVACDGCLQLLREHFLQSAAGNLEDVGQIARQADNLFWILDILIDRQIAEDFLKTWASESEMSQAHSKVPAVHRYEVSRVTARLFVGIGKGQLLASKEVRYLLLQTWLVPFYDDFGWMRRASKGLDRHLIEDGLSNTILTLPLAWQQEILLAWFNRFLNSGEDCPNIRRGFEVWWRRAFWRGNGEQERMPPSRIMTATRGNS